ncbi:anoctamin [Plakobranchus ocellatus]|uniref:Anoctamin n=1 Tax=Plakobranchus ocellatus TaxID=259542 RepID=A0AAV3YK44_9GAST|nr:anoctamin [Plakobranchus ocellatus]
MERNHLNGQASIPLEDYGATSSSKREEDRQRIMDDDDDDAMRRGSDEPDKHSFTRNNQVTDAATLTEGVAGMIAKETVLKFRFSFMSRVPATKATQALQGVEGTRLP